MVMARVRFDPQVHGFDFVNSWQFDQVEREHLPNHFVNYLAQRRVLGPLVVRLASFLLGIPVLRDMLERHFDPLYGLCGGMCFAALDFYRAGLPVPRGPDGSAKPVPGTRLHSYLWKRQLDSLVSDGIRFLAWPIILKYVPRVWPFRGGPAWFLARSKEEWRKLKAAVDGGEPVPIGLMRDTKNAYDNHQVLAIGYDEAGETQITLYLYDPNCPDKVSTASIQFGEQSLDGQESCGSTLTLRGFFCEAYAPAEPGEAIDR
jgi:hypothetical protein